MNITKAQAFVANRRWGLFESFVRQTRWQLVWTGTADGDTILLFLAPKKEHPPVALPLDKAGDTYWQGDEDGGCPRFARYGNPHRS